MIVVSYFSLANLIFSIASVQQSDIIVSKIIHSRDMNNINITNKINTKHVFHEGVMNMKSNNSNVLNDIEDIDESDPTDSTNPNSTFAEIPRNKKDGSSLQVSTVAFLLAVIPMTALIGTFFVLQCKTRSASALNAYVKTSKITTESLDDEGSISVGDRESQSSTRNPLFMHTMFEPQWNPQTAVNSDILAYTDTFNTHH
jgi:hypothetical protein